MSSPGNGGGIHISGGDDSFITGGTISGNAAANEGGGLWNGSGVMTITGTTISDNNADGDDSGASGGGGIFNEGGTVTTDADTAITNNVAVAGASGSGGGVLVAGGSFEATGTTITGNSANRAGGGIEVRDGADGVQAALTLENVILNNNNAGADAPAPGSGGGLHITGGSNSTLRNSTVNNNIAANEGGGLWNGTGQMLIEKLTIDENSANNGGGIYNNGGILLVDQSAITNNSSESFGGGITNVPDATGDIFRTTVSGNTSQADGGGIANFGNFVIDASTVAMNTSTVSGGGLFTGSPGQTDVGGSIIALNSGSNNEDVSGVTGSINYNLIGSDPNGNLQAESDDIINVDPLLGPLQDNGGATLTHALLEESPAYNAGNPDNVDEDQIDQPVFDGRRDIGAFEAQTILLSTQDFLNDDAFTIYPNPTQGDVFITLADSLRENSQIQIIEVGSGKIVKSISSIERFEPISISGLANGVYIITITSESQSMSKKLILAQ